MNSGAARHIMLEARFSRVQRESKTAREKVVPASGQRIRDLGVKTSLLFETNDGIHRCITFRSAGMVKPLISMQKAVFSWQRQEWANRDRQVRNHCSFA